ncbi:MAG: hypothetical protein AAF657_38170 [Acidobacteriota bacterium]
MSYEDEAVSATGSGRDDNVATHPDPEEVGPYETPPSSCDDDRVDPDFPIQGR